MTEIERPGSGAFHAKVRAWLNRPAPLWWWEEEHPLFGHRFVGPFITQRAALSWASCGPVYGELVKRTLDEVRAT